MTPFCMSNWSKWSLFSSHSLSTDDAILWDHYLISCLSKQIPLNEDNFTMSKFSSSLDDCDCLSFLLQIVDSVTPGENCKHNWKAFLYSHFHYSLDNKMNWDQHFVESCRILLKFSVEYCIWVDRFQNFFFQISSNLSIIRVRSSSMPRKYHYSNKIALGILDKYMYIVWSYLKIIIF